MVRHDLPEALDHAAPAIALRRTEQDVPAVEQGRQAGDHGAVDVEERKAGEDDPARRQGVAQRPCAHEGVGDLIAVSSLGQLGGAGRAAGAEQRCQIPGGDHSAAVQHVAAQARDGLAIDGMLHAGAERRRGPGQLRLFDFGGPAFPAPDMVRHADGDDVLDIRSVRDGFHHLVEQVDAGEGLNRQHHLGAGRAQQLGHAAGFQQGVDRQGDAGGLAPPQTEVGLGQVGQDQGDDIARAYAQLSEQIGRAGHFREVVGKAPDGGALVTIRLEEEGQRRRIAEPASGGGDQVIGRGRQLGRPALGDDALDIVLVGERGAAGGARQGLIQHHGNPERAGNP
ncbi:hypothetical protein D3C72_1085950 [compost metagenome]